MKALYLPSWRSMRASNVVAYSTGDSFFARIRSPNTSPVSARARARARVEAGNQRPWPADKVEGSAQGRSCPALATPDGQAAEPRCARTSGPQAGLRSRARSRQNLFRRNQARSKRSKFITLVHAATKSFTNFSFESAHA